MEHSHEEYTHTRRQVIHWLMHGTQHITALVSAPFDTTPACPGATVAVAEPFEASSVVNAHCHCRNNAAVAAYLIEKRRQSETGSAMDVMLAQIFHSRDDSR